MRVTIPLRDASTADVRPRDTERPIILVGFQDHANLGIGYIASVLRSRGYQVRLFDFKQDRSQILEAALAQPPLLVGFSLIFQFYVHRFHELAAYLRDNGVTCHFTMGGHFPSLSYRAALDLVPEVDSIVRFEGELTALGLADRLSTHQNWRDVQGIAYRDGKEPVTTALRTLLHDLDELPYPDRSAAVPTTMLGRVAVPIVASRGCVRTCSFCSIHTFYRTAPGKVVRTRRPAEVVREMRELYESDGATIFLFQDDDFPLFGPVWQRWAREFISELHKNDLPGRVIWKINCRADVIEPELFATMKKAGLYLVYMGLESGSDEGLDTLHKQITVEQNLRAVRVLKELKLMFEFGFMMFDPSSTLESIRQNLDFLRAIVGDGSAAAVFCRMIPYDGTPIKDALEREGRLRGDVCNPDYDFLDPRVGDMYVALKRIVDVTGWIHGHRALSPAINFAWNELAIIDGLFPRLSDPDSYREALRRITRESNELLFQVVDDLRQAFATGGSHPWRIDMLQDRARGFLRQLVVERNDFIARHQAALVHSLQREAAMLYS
jgi:anaerobic magnesium-protoporphyrin IX monomethyl ester cyclase